MGFVNAFLMWLDLEIYSNAYKGLFVCEREYLRDENIIGINIWRMKYLVYICTCEIGVATLR